MKHRIAILAGLLPVAVAAMAPAQAQTIYLAPRVYAAPPPMVMAPTIPPHEAMAIARAAGFSPLTQPSRRGARYVLLASDRAGGQVRVAINIFNGRIVRVAPAFDPRFAYHPARPPVAVPMAVPRTRYGEPMPPPEKDGPPPVHSSRDAAHAPLPPAASPRLANAPDVTGSVPRPTRTPLPRPRPQIASNDAVASDAVVNDSAPAAETSPEAETIGSAPAPRSRPAGRIIPTPRPAVPAKPAETQLVPVAPLD